MQGSIELNVKVSVPKQLVQDLLVSAFEGGSNYWYSELEPIYEGSTAKDKSVRFYEDLMGGFKLRDTTDGEYYTVGSKEFARAFETMYLKFHSHYNDAVNENGDALTGDVFLQILVFDKVIYG